MASKKTLLRVLIAYSYLMLAASGLFFARSLRRHYRQTHATAAAAAPSPPQQGGDDGEAFMREVNPLLGWNELTMVAPFILMYSIAAFCLTTAPFPTKHTKKAPSAAAAEKPPTPRPDRRNRRAFGTACLVVASFLFLILTFSFIVQDKLENQMFSGEEAYRREQLQQREQEREQEQAANTPDGGEEGAAALQLEAATDAAAGGAGGGQCSAGADMSHVQIILSSLDVLFDVLSSMLFGGDADDDSNTYRPAYKKAEPDQNSYFYNFSMLQRADVLLLHVGGLLLSLYGLFSFESDGPTAAPAPRREQEPQERRDNPALTMDALKQLGAGADVSRAKKTTELLAKDRANSAETSKKKQ